MYIEFSIAKSASGNTRPLVTAGKDLSTLSGCWLYHNEQTRLSATTATIEVECEKFIRWKWMQVSLEKTKPVLLSVIYLFFPLLRLPSFSRFLSLSLSFASVCACVSVCLCLFVCLSLSLSVFRLRLGLMVIVYESPRMGNVFAAGKPTMYL
jgi:hypothetical protein